MNFTELMKKRKNRIHLQARRKDSFILSQRLYVVEQIIA